MKNSKIIISLCCWVIILATFPLINSKMGENILSITLAKKAIPAKQIMANKKSPELIHVNGNFTDDTGVIFDGCNIQVSGSYSQTWYGSNFDDYFDNAFTTLSAQCWVGSHFVSGYFPIIFEYAPNAPFANRYKFDGCVTCVGKSN